MTPPRTGERAVAGPEFIAAFLAVGSLCGLRSGSTVAEAGLALPVDFIEEDGPGATLRRGHGLVELYFSGEPDLVKVRPGVLWFGRYFDVELREVPLLSGATGLRPELVMYLMLYAAAIRLRCTHPDGQGAPAPCAGTDRPVRGVRSGLLSTMWQGSRRPMLRRGG
ncbi:hypothetical protein [Streptomyces sp. G1]|uniref:hypothetical protein n=1 Tax=Streptomyces sp. G1 TaxID=361572 RepID=UPI0020308614|nr:hypothetical protein [Streptomyces sp. G1]MCM1969380.1 hypothetical protein [Streptomyces sp. G1]